MTTVLISKNYIIADRRVVSRNLMPVLKELAFNIKKALHTAFPKLVSEPIVNKPENTVMENGRTFPTKYRDSYVKFLKINGKVYTFCGNINHIEYALKNIIGVTKWKRPLICRKLDCVIYD